jgi:hypothetical protein
MTSALQSLTDVMGQNPAVVSRIVARPWHVAGSMHCFLTRSTFSALRSNGTPCRAVLLGNVASGIIRGLFSRNNLRRFAKGVAS